MVREGSTRRRSPGQRAGLTAEEIVRCARAAAEQRGVEGVTVRGIAAELGVAPNALYSYFPDRTAILDALLDSLLGEIEPVDPDQGSWEDGIAALMRDSRRVLLAHPHLVPLFVARPGGPNAMRLGEAMLRILARGGVHGTDAVLALRALLSYTLGAAALEAARLVDPGRAQRVQRASKVMQALPEDEFSRTREVAGSLSAHPAEADFEVGLRWLIRGIGSG